MCNENCAGDNCYNLWRKKAGLPWQWRKTWRQRHNAGGQFWQGAMMCKIVRWPIVLKQQWQLCANERMCRMWDMKTAQFEEKGDKNRALTKFGALWRSALNMECPWKLLFGACCEAAMKIVQQKFCDFKIGFWADNDVPGQILRQGNWDLWIRVRGRYKMQFERWLILSWI